MRGLYTNSIHLRSVIAPIILIGGILFSISFSGCVSTPHPYTTEHTKRQDQVLWIQEDLIKIFANFYGEEINESKSPSMRSQIADLNRIIQTCYLKGSNFGNDQDGGIRAMNFFKKHFYAEGGDYWSWIRAIDYKPTTIEEEKDYVFVIGIPKGYK